MYISHTPRELNLLEESTNFYSLSMQKIIKHESYYLNAKVTM